MDLRDKLNGAVRAVGLKVVTAQIMRYASDAASGKLGPDTQSRYEFWKGKKTLTGCALMIAGVGAAALGYPDVAEWTAGGGAFLATVGLVDRGYRTDIPAEVAQSGVYRFLASHGGLVGGLLVTASTMLTDATACTWCLALDKVVLVLGAVAVQVKLIDPAWRSKPPIVDLDVLSRYAEGEDPDVR